jgi:hypothetical protein
MPPSLSTTRLKIKPAGRPEVALTPLPSGGIGRARLRQLDRPAADPEATGCPPPPTLEQVQVSLRD